MSVFLSSKTLRFSKYLDKEMLPKVLSVIELFFCFMLLFRFKC